LPHDEGFGLGALMGIDDAETLLVDDEEEEELLLLPEPKGPPPPPPILPMRGGWNEDSIPAADKGEEDSGEEGKVNEGALPSLPLALNMLNCDRPLCPRRPLGADGPPGA